MAICAHNAIRASCSNSANDLVSHSADLSLVMSARAARSFGTPKVLTFSNFQDVSFPSPPLYSMLKVSPFSFSERLPRRGRGGGVQYLDKTIRVLRQDWFSKDVWPVCISFA